jgi:hypothetical protein
VENGSRGTRKISSDGSSDAGGVPYGWGREIYVSAESEVSACYISLRDFERKWVAILLNMLVGGGYCM